MKTLFHLLRHASHGHVGRILTGRQPGAPLTPAGRDEALRLARHLASQPLDALYTSPRLRARQTAAVIARETGMECKVADQLDEIDFGHWSGKSFDELAADPDWQRWNEDRDAAATPVGETMAGVSMRLVPLIDQLRRDFAGGAVALVSHSDVIKAVICHYLGLPFRNVHDFEIAPASLTTLAIDDYGGSLMALDRRPSSVTAGEPA